MGRIRARSHRGGGLQETQCGCSQYRQCLGSKGYTRRQGHRHRSLRHWHHQRTSHHLRCSKAWQVGRRNHNSTRQGNLPGCDRLGLGLVRSNSELAHLSIGRYYSRCPSRRSRNRNSIALQRNRCESSRKPRQPRPHRRSPIVQRTPNLSKRRPMLGRQAQRRAQRASLRSRRPLASGHNFLVLYRYLVFFIRNGLVGLVWDWLFLICHFAHL